LSTAIHEAYPGHYVQFLWIQHVDSKARKLLGAASNAEGWAHYCEEMMLDEGYTQDSRMRLGQVAGRSPARRPPISSASRCTPGKTELSIRAVEFFQKDGYQTHEVARSAKPSVATSDPTYLYYTLGKLQNHENCARITTR